MNVRMTEELQKEICAMKEAGVTVKKICEKTGVSNYTVWRYATRGEKFKENNSGTLCWLCALSALGDISPCSWHRKAHTPRKDWEAERKDFFTATGEVIESYIVKSCPAFVRG